MSGVSSPVYGSCGGSGGAKLPSTLLHLSGTIRDDVIDWGAGATAVVVWEAALDSTAIVSDTQISEGLYATPSGLRFSDGTSSVSYPMSWSAGNRYTIQISANNGRYSIGVFYANCLRFDIPHKTKELQSGSVIFDYPALLSTDFSYTGGARTATKDTSVYRSGLSTLKIVNTDSGATLSITRNVDIALTQPPVLSLICYIPDYTNQNGLTIQVSVGDTNFTNYYSYAYSVSSTGHTDKQRNGWHYINVGSQDWMANGSPSWTSGIKSIRIRQVNASGRPGGIIYYDALYINPVSKAKLMIHCDDVTKSWYTDARAILNNLGLKSCLAVAADWVANPAYMSTAELHTMQNEGHEIIVHSANRIGTAHQLTTVEMALADITYNKNYVAAEFGEKGARFFAFANGQYYLTSRAETTILDGMRKIGVYASRTTDANSYRNTKGQALGVDNLMLIGEIGPWSGDTVAAMNSAIDKLISRGDIGVEVYHGPYVFSGATLTEFSEHMNYVKSKVDSGELEVVTFSQWYDHMDPEPSKTEYLPFDGSITLPAQSANAIGAVKRVFALSGTPSAAIINKLAEFGK